MLMMLAARFGPVRYTQLMLDDFTGVVELVRRKQIPADADDARFSAFWDHSVRSS